MVARILLRENRVPEAATLYEIARSQVPDYNSWHLEYTYFLLACREKLNGSLDQADRALAARAADEGRFLLGHGFSESGMAERYVGRLLQLRGEWAEAIPFLEAARPKMAAEDLVACDQALVLSYIRAGRAQDAVGLVDRGIRESGRFAPVYRRMREEIGRGAAETATPR
jgi:tetratricopeptide (TPR) repeat protein